MLTKQDFVYDLQKDGEAKSGLRKEHMAINPETKDQRQNMKDTHISPAALTFNVQLPFLRMHLVYCICGVWKLNSSPVTAQWPLANRWMSPTVQL